MFEESLFNLIVLDCILTWIKNDFEDFMSKKSQLFINN